MPILRTTADPELSSLQSAILNGARKAEPQARVWSVLHRSGGEFELNNVWLKTCSHDFEKLRITAKRAYSIGLESFKCDRMLLPQSRFLISAQGNATYGRLLRREQPCRAPFGAVPRGLEEAWPQVLPSIVPTVIRSGMPWTLRNVNNKNYTIRQRRNS